MNRWSRVEGTGRTLLLLLGVLVAGCGGGVNTPVREDSGGGAAMTGDAGQAGQLETPLPGSGVPRDTSPELGWSIRDDTPYGRVGASAVVDTMADRLIVFGGRADDIWSLALSGPHQHQWSQLLTQGDRPPTVQTQGIYDESGDRIVALFDANVDGPKPHADAQLWQLSLGEQPTWTRLATSAAAGRELGGARLALDSGGHRLFAMGGGFDRCGVWSFSLDEGGEWSRVADVPPGSCSAIGPFVEHDDGGSLVFDAPRQRLLMFGLDNVWELALSTQSWSSLGTPMVGSFGATPVLDEASARVIYLGGEASEGGQVWSFSLETNGWTLSYIGSADAQHWDASGAADTKRNRVIYFSGFSPTYSRPDSATSQFPNATWQLALDSLDLQPLTPDTRGISLATSSALVWDAGRNRAVSFGTFGSGLTYTRGVDSDIWQTLEAHATPNAELAGVVYDTTAAAIVTFGSYASGSPEVRRLPSAQGSSWETLPVAPGPEPRYDYLIAYDPEGQRTVIHGGNLDTHGTSVVPLDDTWVLSSAGEMAWSQLTPVGEAPEGPLVGAYDPVGHRVIAYGGVDVSGNPELYALSFAADPEWNRLDASGQAPTTRGNLFYDADGERMIFVDGPVVFSLELGQRPAWHRFCSLGFAPPTFASPFGTIALGAALAPDGVFLAAGNGAFRFDLATPYCG
jgi:hypothetical protein